MYKSVSEKYACNVFAIRIYFSEYFNEREAESLDKKILSSIKERDSFNHVFTQIFINARLHLAYTILI